MQCGMNDELKDAFLSVSLSDLLLEALDAAAAEEDRTRSEMARHILHRPTRVNGVKLAGMAHLAVVIPQSMMQMLTQGAEEAGWTLSEYVRFNLARHRTVKKHLDQLKTKEKVTGQ